VNDASDDEVDERMTRGVRLATAALVLTAATTIVLHRQLAAYTSVPDLGDPLFSMWRLAWVAHQAPLDPRHLFDANIFHPAARTLAYSDAMLLPAFVAAPALWLHAPLPAVYTTLVLLSFVAAGVAMFALVDMVTAHFGAALLAAIVFAFDTFRFAHYSHLELLCTTFMPLALLFVVRALVAGRWRDGALAGVCVAAQAACSLYYGAFLAVSLAVFVVCWSIAIQRPDRRRTMALALAAAVAGAAAVPLTRPYVANRQAVGVRGEGEVRAYSATPHDYITAYRRSAVYGLRLWDQNDAERKLFPGTLPLIAGAAALVPPVAPLAVPSVVALAATIDLSFGLNGRLYTWLYRGVPAFRAFRVPARFRAVGGLYLALLAGLAAAAFARRFGDAPWTRAALCAAGVLILVDVHPSLELQPVWAHGPRIYDRIPDPHAVVANLPLPWDRDPFWRDPVFMYFSTFNWHPMVNGSSGFAPPWYEPLGAISREFPADVALDAYKRLGTDYFVLHQGFYGNQIYNRVVAQSAAQPRLQLVAVETWEEGECRLYRLVR
jgi:hypothetical protein